VLCRGSAVRAAGAAMAQPGKLLKEQKYDRQLRLWGDHGQEALESAHVCLINATATGTEILKNLVLPGIGSFTIIDGNQVSGEDAGNKYVLFFSNTCMLGKAVHCHGRVRPKSQLHLLSQGDLTLRWK